MATKENKPLATFIIIPLSTFKPSCLSLHESRAYLYFGLPLPGYTVLETARLASQKAF